MDGDAKWMNNVGEVFLSEESECFWMLPAEYFFNEKLRITSPRFSYKDETWCLVKQVQKSHLPCGLTFWASLYLWKKVRDSTPSYEYTFKAHLKSIENELILASGSVDMNFGFQCLKFCPISCKSELKKCVTLNEIPYCGLMKLFFEIQKQQSIIDFPSCTTATTEDNSESNEESEKSDQPEPKGTRLLAENLKQIFLDGRMSDAVLKVDGREFNVHKVILVARSPVFESMFQQDMAEKDSNAVDIPDCTAESFEVFLRYLYTGSAETMSTSNVYNVYYAADKYHIDDLKEKCVKFMINNISVETFCDVIALSLRHGESELQKAATDFFCQNIKKIIKTVQWQKYMDENSTQANELLIKALNA